MARPLSWLNLIPSIQRKVNDAMRRHYELRDLEDLFKVWTRSARDLLNLLPTRTIGNARLVEREDQLDFLSKLSEADDPTIMLSEMGKGTRKPGRPPLQEGKRTKPEPLRRLYAADVAERMEHLPENVTVEVAASQLNSRMLQNSSEPKGITEIYPDRVRKSLCSAMSRHA